MENNLSKEAVDVLQQMKNGEKVAQITPEATEEIRQAMLGFFKGRQKLTPEILAEQVERGKTIFGSQKEKNNG
jgi:hypothetical protein